MNYSSDNYPQYEDQKYFSTVSSKPTQAHIERQAPVFLRRPEDQYCSEGDTVRFDAVILSPYKTTIKWMHNNRNLMSSSRYKTYFDGKNACLIISRVSQFDVGNFTIIADNKDGYDACGVELRIIGPNKTRSRTASIDAGYASVKSQSSGSQRVEPQGIDTTSYIPVDELNRLETSRTQKSANYEGPLIDDRPIINTQGILELEKRRQMKAQTGLQGAQISHIKATPLRRVSRPIEQDLSHRAIHQLQGDALSPSNTDVTAYDSIQLNEANISVDTRPIVNPEAFKYLERPTAVIQDSEPRCVIDESHIVDPRAFKYVELPAYQPVTISESGVDTTSIVDPRHFRSLEHKPNQTKVSVEPEIDSRPIVHPSAFKYIDPSIQGIRRNVRTQAVRNSLQSEIDTSSLIDQNAFKHLEKKAKQPVDTLPEIDTTSMVPLDAFKYIEPVARRVRPLKKRTNSPTIDQRSYIDTKLIAGFENVKTIPDNVQAGIDDSSYISPNAVKYLQEVATYRSPDQHIIRSEIDSAPIISPQAFKDLELPKISKSSDVAPEIDDRGYIDPNVLIRLENKTKQEYVDTKELGIAPIFTRKLTDMHVQEGSNITLAACYQASPIPEITWYKDNALLSTSSRIFYFIDINRKTAILSIKQVTADDSGQYKLVAYNSFGESSTNANIRVDEEPNIDQQNFVPLEGILDLELSQFVAHENQENQDGFQNIKADLMANANRSDKNLSFITRSEEKRPPIFRQGLNDTTAEEGNNVKMQAQVEGVPTPELSLLRAPNILQESNRIKFDYNLNNSTVTITINSCSPIDSGVYTILAKNENGIANTFAELRVLSTDREHLLEKANIKALGSKCIEGKEGDDIQVGFSISGKPLPTIAVKFNKMEVSASSRFSVTTNFFEKTVFVIIKNVHNSDAGEYEVEAYQNSSPVSSSKFILKVSKDEAISTDYRVNPNKLDHLVKQKKSDDISAGVDQTSFSTDLSKFEMLERHKTEVSEIIDDIEPICFETNLRPVIAIEGRHAVLKVTLKGKSFPEATWFKDGVAVELSSRVYIHTDFSEKLIALVLKSLRLSDQGVYKVVLRNNKGEVSQKAKLTVKQDAKAVVDNTSYIDYSLVKALEHHPKEEDEIISGVDSQAFINPEKFKYLTEGTIYKLDFREDTRDHCNPQILQPLKQSVTVNETEDIFLDCIVSLAHPIPKIIWKKDGHNLANSSRISCTYNMMNNSCSLRISHARLTDAGLYVVSIENYLGSQSCQCAVDVTKDVMIDSNSFISSSAFEKFENKEKPSKDIYVSHVDDRAFINPRAFQNLEVKPKCILQQEEPLIVENLKIIARQKDLTVDEGKDIFLYATLAGKPIDNVTWMRNHNILNASSRISMDIYLPNLTCWLQISKAIPADMGVYNLLVTNKVSSVDAQFYVDVHKDVDIEQSPIINESAFTLIEASDRGKQIDQIQAGVDSKGYIDYRKFMKLESVPSKADIIAGVDNKSFVDINKLQAFDENMNKISESKDCDLPDKGNEFIPLFKSNLTDVVANEDDHVCTLSVLVDGNPSPQINWFKYNSKIDASHRISADYDKSSKIATLSIHSLSLIDEGRYHIYAQNCHGTNEQSCYLHVQPVHLIDSYSKAGAVQLLDNQSFIPKFLESTKSEYVVHEGDNFNIEINLMCNCECNLNVLKDGRNLETSGRLDYSHEVIKQKLILRLSNISAMDSGRYVCTAANKMGKTSTEFSILVINQKDVSRDWIISNKDAIEALSRDEHQQKAVDIQPGVDVSPITKHSTDLDTIISSSKNIEEQSDILETTHCNLSFNTPIVNQVANEYDQVIFFAVANDKPDKILWMFNDVPLHAASRFHTTCQVNEIALKIDKCSLEDAGVYKLIISNESSSALCSASLKISTKTDAVRNLKPFDILDKQKISQPIIFEEQTHVPLSVKSLMAQKCHSSEGQSITLRVQITNGQPKEYQWIKNGSELSQSSRFTTMYKQRDNEIIIRIESLSSIDEGIYKLMLTDFTGKSVLLPVTELFVIQSMGIDTTSMICSLEDLIKLEKSPPMLQPNITPGVDTTNYISLQNFQGLEEPLKHNDEMLESGVDTSGYIPMQAFVQLDQNTIKKDIEDNDLDYNPVYNKDLLTYLENNAGRKDYVQVVEYHDTLQNTCSVGAMDDVNTTEGADFHLSSHYTAFSDIKIFWYHDNKQLEQNYHIQWDCDLVKKVITLKVSNAKISDSGMYVLQVMTDTTQSSTSAVVTINKYTGLNCEPIVKSIYENIVEEEIKESKKHYSQIKKV
ncbi:hypothetical protein GJ496_004663 [Pomphorhynchus laevis]|nr:hypothetical protein GJ496_004663 [Pomphorhynchus laevis]